MFNKSHCFVVISILNVFVDALLVQYVVVEKLEFLTQYGILQYMLLRNLIKYLNKHYVSNFINLCRCRISMSARLNHVWIYVFCEFMICCVCEFKVLKNFLLLLFKFVVKITSDCCCCIRFTTLRFVVTFSVFVK